MGSEFDRQGQQAAFRVISWSAGAALGLLWLIAAVVVAAWAGRPFWPDILWTLASAGLMGRLAAALVRWRLRQDWVPTEIEVSLDDPGSFRRRLARRMGWLHYARLENGLTGLTFLPGRRVRAFLPPLFVDWSGRGARLRGPRFLVRMAVKLAVA